VIRKVGFEEMEHEFSCRTLRPEKQDYLLRCSIALGNFPLKRPKKSCSFYFSTGFSGNLFGNGKQFLSFLNEDKIIFIVCFIHKIVGSLSLGNPSKLVSTVQTANCKKYIPPSEPPAARPLFPLFKIKIRFRTLAVQAKILFGEITYKKKEKIKKYTYWAQLLPSQVY